MNCASSIKSNWISRLFDSGTWYFDLMLSGIALCCNDYWRCLKRFSGVRWWSFLWTRSSRFLLKLPTLWSFGCLSFVWVCRCVLRLIDRRLHCILLRILRRKSSWERKPISSRLVKQKTLFLRTWLSWHTEYAVVLVFRLWHSNFQIVQILLT